MSKHHGPAHRKFNKIMDEFDAGTLHSSSGGKVTSMGQALAIAYSEARKKNPRFGKKGK